MLGIRRYKIYFIVCNSMHNMYFSLCIDEDFFLINVTGICVIFHLIFLMFYSLFYFFKFFILLFKNIQSFMEYSKL